MVHGSTSGGWELIPLTVDESASGASLLSYYGEAGVRRVRTGLDLVKPESNGPQTTDH